jgi:homoaconitate hydratase
VGWFPVDDTTLEYLAQRRDSGKLHRNPTDDELALWRSAPPAADPDARYAARIRIDLSRVGPHVAGPDTVRVAAPLAEIERRRIRVNKAYLVSCANSRSEDLAAAAAVLDGRRVADGVELYVAAASREVQQQAEASGVWRTLLLAGARPLPPGCGPCIGLGAGLLEPGEVGISATNRNFKGRMGSRDAECWLTSPAVVAASAAAGYIRGPLDAPARTPEKSIELDDTTLAEAASVEIFPGFPARTAGRLVFVPRDSLDTDAIFGKDHTYQDGMTREEMARVVFENHDPGLAERLRAGDVIVGGASFGTGSSREQAVTALAAKGVALVIAASFSATYLRNAFNNGFPCLECPELVSALRERWSAEIAGGARAIIDESRPVEVDFGSGTIDHAGREFRFAPLDALAQALVVEGGIENRVRRQLAGD